MPNFIFLIFQFSSWDGRGFVGFWQREKKLFVGDDYDHQTS
jgi:hypothetical protein